MTLNEAIDRAKKLLALAKGNQNENELKAATAAADKIIQEFRISVAQLEADGATTEPFVRKVVRSQGRRTAWIETLLFGITAHNGCAWYLSSGRVGGFEYNDSGTLQGRKGSEGRCEYTVVGRSSDTEIVEYMLTYLVGECERIGKQNSKGKGVRFGVAYLMGLALGVKSQFETMRATARAQANKSCALVLLDKREEESRTFMNGDVEMKSAGAVHGANDSYARQQGYAAGKNINIRAGITSSSTAKLST